MVRTVCLTMFSWCNVPTHRLLCDNENEANTRLSRIDIKQMTEDDGTNTSDTTENYTTVGKVDTSDFIWQ